MDSQLFNTQSNPEMPHADPSSNSQTESSGLNFSMPNSDTNSQIQNGFHVNSFQPDSSHSTSADSHPSLESSLFANACSPMAASIPSETDNHFHILAKLGLSTSNHNNVHTHVQHQKPCHKIAVRLHENHSRPVEQAQSGRNSDPLSLFSTNDLFSQPDTSASAPHEPSLTTTVTPVVPRPLRKPVTEERQESQPIQTTLTIEESPQKSSSTTPDYSNLNRETPMSTTHTAMDSTPHHTPHHADDVIDPLNQDNLRRSSMTTDQTVNSRRESSASEALKDNQAEKLGYIGNENLINIKSDMRARPDNASNERYRQTSLQITRENKAVQKCSCNIF